MAQKIPTTIITGFLGAGKTTLVRHVLANAGGRRIALIINEFGETGVDRDVLRGCGDEACRDEDMIELANGCICCTVADEFIPTITALLERPSPPDHIIIETSGLALPQPLVQAFNWPQIRAGVSVDGVVTLVDADALARGRFASDEREVDARRRQDEMLDHDTPLGELFEDQLVCADLVVLNKTDLVAPERLAQVESELEKHMRAGTSVIRAARGVVDVAVLLGMGMAAQEHLEGRQSHHELNHDGVPHEHDDFDSFSLFLPPAPSREKLEEAIRKTILEHDILRLKGFAALEGAAARLAVQAVGPRLESWFDRPWEAQEAERTSLVVIGKSPLDKETIEASLRGMLPDAG